MVNPSGYTALDLVGFTDRGPYDPNYNYVANDLAHHGGSIWCCLIDDTMGIEPTAGVNWRFWVKDSQEGISDIVNILGAKNLLDVTPRLKAEPSARSYLSYDGQIITVNGTVSTSEYTRLNGVTGTFTLPKGEYIFSGTSSNSDIKLALRKNGTEFVLSQNPNATFTSDGDTNTFTFLINVKAGTYTNETVKAMIRPSGIDDDTWQPYTKTNKELTSDIQTLANQTEENTEDIETNLASINILKTNGNWRTGLRFKNLGTSFTSAQATALANGDFSEFWNGDYWVINGHNWRIVDNSGWARRRGDTNFDSNSLVVMPDDNLVVAQAYLIDGYTSQSNADTHGYANCGYRTDEHSGYGRTQCKTLFQNAFGSSHVASHRELMSTSRGTGGALSWAWQDADVELPSEVNIYGHSVWGNGLESGVDEPSFNIGDRWGQFMLFRLAPYMAINRGQNYWLRDIHSASAFAAVNYIGAALSSAPSDPTVGLRPYSIIK